MRIFRSLPELGADLVAACRNAKPICNNPKDMPDLGKPGLHKTRDWGLGINKAKHLLVFSAAVKVACQDALATLDVHELTHGDRKEATDVWEVA